MKNSSLKKSFVSIFFLLIFWVSCFIFFSLPKENTLTKRYENFYAQVINAQIMNFQNWEISKESFEDFFQKIKTKNLISAEYIDLKNNQYLETQNKLIAQNYNLNAAYNFADFKGEFSGKLFQANLQNITTKDKTQEKVLMLNTPVVNSSNDQIEWLLRTYYTANEINQNLKRMQIINWLFLCLISATFISLVLLFRQKTKLKEYVMNERDNSKLR